MQQTIVAVVNPLIEGHGVSKHAIFYWAPPRPTDLISVYGKIMTRWRGCRLVGIWFARGLRCLQLDMGVTTRLYNYYSGNTELYRWRTHWKLYITRTDVEGKWVFFRDTIFIFKLESNRINIYCQQPNVDIFSESVKDNFPTSYCGLRFVHTTLRVFFLLCSLNPFLYWKRCRRTSLCCRSAEMCGAT